MRKLVPRAAQFCVAVSLVSGCGGGGGAAAPVAQVPTPVIAVPVSAPVEPSWTLTSTQTIDYEGTYFARGVLANSDKSATLVFSGPAASNVVAGYFTCAPVPFKALRFAIDGTFSDDTTRVNPQGASAIHAAKIVVADFNGDGVDDIYSGNSGCDNNTLPQYLSGETGTLLLSSGTGYVNATSTLPPLKNFVHSVAAADVRANGNIDILVGVLGAQSNPNAPSQYLSGTNITFGIYVGPYILRSNKSSVLTYDGTSLPTDISQSFGPPKASPGGFTASRFVDVDGDGFPDLVVGSEKSSERTGAVFLNDKKGGFLPNPIVLPVGIFGANNTLTMDIVSADLNGDGKLDLIFNQTSMIPYYAKGKIQVLINQGNAFVDATDTYFPSQIENQGWSQYIHLVDLDGDGKNDLLLDMDNPHDADAIAYRFDGKTFTVIPRTKLPSSITSLTPMTIGGVTQLVSVAPVIGTGKTKVTVFQRK
jgi:hypothetical protein